MYVSDDDIDRERNKSNSSNGKQPSFEASDSEQMSSSDTTTRFNFGAQPNDSNARSSRTFSKQPRTSKPSTSKRRQQSPAGSQSKRTNRGRGQRDRTDSLSDSLAGKRERMNADCNKETERSFFISGMTVQPINIVKLTNGPGKWYVHTLLITNSSSNSTWRHDRYIPNMVS